MVDDLNGRLFSQFAMVGKSLRAWARSQTANQPSMTPGRVAVLLGLLGEDGPVSMATLGAAHDLSPRTMTVLIAGLEREGLVRRAADPGDRRVSLLSLTPAGRSLSTRHLVPAQKRAAVLFDDMPEEDRRELLRLLTATLTLLEPYGITAPGHNAI